jgi:ribokinase
MFKTKYDIVTIGSATRDVFLKMEGVETRKHTDSETGVEQCFPLGSKIEVKEIVFTTGGGGTNAAVTFGRQGFNTGCVGVVGNDLAGQEILEELKREKVEPLFQKHSDDLTAYSTILMNPDAERTILSYKGEGQHFETVKIDFGELQADWFYIDSLGGHYDFFEALVKYALANNIKIACNPGGKELDHGLEKLKLLLKNIDIYITNKEEGAQLVGTEHEKKNETLDRLQEVVKGIVILSDGHKGVQVRANGKEYSAGVPDSPIVERTGAGDAFGSGFVSEYIREGDIIKAIQFGTANASSVVTRVGAKAGILKKGDWGPWPLVEVEER